MAPEGDILADSDILMYARMYWDSASVVKGVCNANEPLHNRLSYS